MWNFLSSLHYVRRWWHSNDDMKFYMRKYDKRNFCRFLRLIGVIVTLVLKRQLFCINICCFIITVVFRSCEMSGLILFNNSTPKTPIRWKDLGISWTCWVIAYFVSNFVAMTTGVSRCRIFCHHSTAMCKDFGYISYTNWVIILFQILLPWQHGLFVVEFVWHHSKPPDRRKKLSDISYTSWVTVNFVSNFVSVVV